MSVKVSTNTHSPGLLADHIGKRQTDQSQSTSRTSLISVNVTKDYGHEAISRVTVS